MLFSIIIPTYNERQYIEPCLQSIQNQSFSRSEFEIIVADSHSSDGTAEIAARLADKVLTIPRKGIAHARNAGAKEAAGNILVFVDADVVLQPDFLSVINEVFQRTKTEPLRSSSSLTVPTLLLQESTSSPSAQAVTPSPPQPLAPPVVAVTGQAIPTDGTWFPRFVYHATYALVGLFNAFGIPLFPGLCVAYRRQAFEQVGGFREDFGISEDLDLSRRISKLGRCVYERRARAFVSTRRLERHAVSTVLFHIYHDLRYLCFGKTARRYPKSEELKSAADLWRMNKE